MKRMAALLLALVMCLSISALGDEELIGSWKVDYDYMAEQGLIPEEELAAYKSGENVLMEFLPDGTLNLYYGQACDYTYTEDKVTMIYTDSFFSMLDFEELPTVNIEYAYTLNGDELILLTSPEEGNYLICRRESGEEGLVGCWNVIAQLDDAEYAEYLKGKPLSERLKGMFDFKADGTCMMWISIADELPDVPDGINPVFTYTVDSEILTVEIEGDTETMSYGFEDGRLVITITDSYFDGEDWVDTEEKLFLTRVQ